MVRISPGDLVAVESGGEYHYAVLLDRQLMFGGNWCFVFHRTSGEVLDAGEVLSGPADGFHAFVDFIHAKREGRLTRVAKKVDTTPFRACGYLKQAGPTQGRADRWWITDMATRQMRIVDAPLSDEQRRYPTNETIDDVLMVERVRQRWLPELDPRI